MEVDVTKTLPNMVRVEDSDGKVFEQILDFEWVPSYCEKCCNVGHDCEAI